MKGWSAYKEEKSAFCWSIFISLCGILTAFSKYGGRGIGKCRHFFHWHSCLWGEGLATLFNKVLYDTGDEKSIGKCFEAFHT